MCDEGDIEDDLPPLSNNDPIARVGFISLALVATPSKEMIMPMRGRRRYVVR